MKLIEAPEHRPWPKFTADMLAAEGDPKPVFVMPVLVRRDDGEVAWHSVHIRIGELKGPKGAVYNSHTPAVAKEKADQLRADADRAGTRGVVTFKVELNNTSRKTSLTPADARRVARAIEEAQVLLGNQALPETLACVEKVATRIRRARPEAPVGLPAPRDGSNGRPVRAGTPPGSAGRYGPQCVRVGGYGPA